MSALRSDGNRRGTALALAALGLWVGGTACTAIIGVSDLPPATGTEAEAGRPEAGHDGATTHDATSDGTTDATRDARQPDAQVDATRADASEAGHVDTGTVDAGHDAAPPPAFVVSPLSLPFGDAGGKPGYIACGSGAAPTRELTLTNNSSATLSWWTSLSQGAASPYTLSTSCTPSATCTLGTGDAGVKVITITGPAVAADAGAQTYDETLTVFSTAAGEPSTAVSLTAASYGAVIAFSESNVAFGVQPANQPDGGYHQTLQLENNGNGPFAGTLAVRSSPEAGTDALSFVITEIADAAPQPDATLIDVPSTTETPFTLSFDPAGNAREAGAALVVAETTANVLCAPLPTAIPLSGAGTMSPVSVSPSSLNFNQSANNGIGVSCGTAGAAQTVRVTNSSTTPGTITRLALGTTYFTVPATPLILPAATASGDGSVVVTITPGTIPASAVPGTSYGDTLTITTSLTGDKPHAVPLQMTAAGAVLSIPYTNVAVPSVRPGQRGQTTLFVTNTGNVNVQNITIATTNPLFQWQMEEIQPFQTQQFQLNFSPTATTTEVYTGNSTFTVPTGTPICSPPVASGTPFNGVLSVSLQGYAISTLYNEFGGQMIAKFPGKCAAAGQQGLSQPFNFALGTGGNSNVVKWSAVLTGPDTAFFTLSGINGTLPQAGNTQVTLTALGLSSTSGLTRLQSLAGLNALLTFTLTDSGDNVQVYPVPVWEQLQGVYLVWGESDLVVPDQSSTGLTLYNWNGFGTGVTLTSNSTAFPLTAISSNAQLNRPVTATVSDNNAGTMATTTITASVAASLPLCAPVPPPLDVSRGP